MTERDRFKFLYGPYRTPRFRFGDVVFCELRGEVKIVGLRAGIIDWPTCRVGNGSRALILYDALARAVRTESAQAVGCFWGVCPCTVWTWRKALDVPQVNDGTKRLKREYALEPGITAARKKAWAKARDPIRCRKIAAARRGMSFRMSLSVSSHSLGCAAPTCRMVACLLADRVEPDRLPQRTAVLLSRKAFMQGRRSRE